MAGSLLILMEYATCFEYAYGGILEALLKSRKAFGLKGDGVSIAESRESPRSNSPLVLAVFPNQHARSPGVYLPYKCWLIPQP